MAFLLFTLPSPVYCHAREAFATATRTKTAQHKTQRPTPIPGRKEKGRVTEKQREVGRKEGRNREAARGEENAGGRKTLV